MTDAPTTRETADHADHIGDATTMIDHAELARLADEMVGLLAPSQGERLLEYERHQLDVASRIQSLSRALLSEIAALRGEVDRWHSAYEIAHDQATANGSAARQAERQRDELRKALERIADDVIPEIAPSIASQALANQGADQ